MSNAAVKVFNVLPVIVKTIADDNVEAATVEESRTVRVTVPDSFTSAVHVQRPVADATEHIEPTLPVANDEPLMSPTTAVSELYK